MCFMVFKSIVIFQFIFQPLTVMFVLQVSSPKVKAATESSTFQRLLVSLRSL